jgi:urease accessory protein UreE
MSMLRRPDWTEPMGTGLWGLGYRLPANLGLVLLSSGTTLPSENPERLWPFILTQDRQRHKAAEHAVAEEKEVGLLLEHQVLGHDDLLCVREKHLDELMRLLEQEFVHQCNK